MVAWKLFLLRWIEYWRAMVMDAILISYLSNVLLQGAVSIIMCLPHEYNSILK